MQPLLIGGIAGLASGLFGIGGAIIATPLLRLSGVEPLVALATPLPGVIPTALAGAVAYWRHGLVRWETAAWILLGGLPTTVVGALTTRIVGGQSLMLLTGLLLCLVGLRFLWESRGIHPLPEATEALVASPSWALLVGIGAITGFLGGLLAIGGGIILVPALTLLLGFPLKQALATSLVCVAGLALPGALVHTWLGHIRADVLLPFLAGSIPLSYLGGSLAVRLPSRQLRLLYGLATIAFAVYFLWTQWRG
ncbi:MAG: sulfite exporter TauE/SafE family protein [Candidatus Kapabacteria bacterium]|nr:sulfite exporter TauE/SafE family protein [Candidatus Kapabacteria bacterium]MDW8013002.1 sulfite exporter TauE/SafE family protein [Bacteroidota bacterium]